MVSIVKKNIKGNDYLYLVDSIRTGKKVRQKTIKYIGPKRPVRKEELDCMKLSYSNEDWVLSKAKDQLSYQDHKLLKETSDKHKSYLKSADPLTREKENNRFLSIFIANSNAIEGSTLTPSDTYKYLFEDIVPYGKTKKELHMATNLLNAWNYMQSQIKTKPSLKHLQELHKLVNKDIETDATLGKFKPIQNYVGTSLTTSFLFVEEKLKKLLTWTTTAKKSMNDFEIAFQSHVQFEVIHPFIDGNGRVGRLLLNWLLIQFKLEPLAIDVSARAEYILTLENARRGNLKAICSFCMAQYLKTYSYS